MTIADERITQLAQIVHEANRAYCQTIGDTSQLPWDDTSPEIQNSAKLGVKAIVDNPEITPEQLHASWSEQKIKDGWVYGRKKDSDAKTHPCLVTYDNLPARQRFKDYLFGNIVKTYLNFK